MLRSLALLPAGAALAVALTACAAGGAVPAAPEPLDTSAAWLDSGRLIAVTTLGSSSCIPAAEAAELQADGSVRVELVDPDGAGSSARACTADLVTRVSLVGVPDGVDPAQDLQVEVVYGNAAGTTAIAGAAGLAGPGTATDYAPSASWMGRDGGLVFLTWGSSSCAPVVEDVAATAPAEVTVTLETPAADRVCTLDMAPRAGLAADPGVEIRAGAQLVLSGDTFDAVRVPIVGS